MTTKEAFQDFQYELPWPRSRSLTSMSIVKYGLKVRTCLVDMVHFEDLREPFDRMDWYLYSDLYYTLFLDCHFHGYETLHAIH